MAKPLILSDIRNRAGAFVADCRDAERYERGEAQEFVSGLLKIFGISGRTAAVYEKRAQRASTGQRGYIDALISGTALIEMKSAGEDLVKDAKQSRIISEHPESVRSFRAKSSAASTRAIAATAHLFGQRSQPDAEYLAIPQVFSEQREYMTEDLKALEAIAGNRVYKCKDSDASAFSIISSSMFITWQKTIGARIKNDPASSNTLSSNSFPLPGAKEKDQKAVLEAGMGVVDARQQHPGRTLAEHFTPEAMAPSLVKAQAVLDLAVHRAMAQRRKFHSNEQRAPFLFERYGEMTAQ